VDNGLDQGTIKLTQEALAPEVLWQQRGVFQTGPVPVEAERTGYRADVPDDGPETDRFGRRPLHQCGE
jgi:hypothetical protein